MSHALVVSWEEPKTHKKDTAMVDYGEAVKMYQGGMNLAEIGRHFGVRWTSIKKGLQRRGVAIDSTRRSSKRAHAPLRKDFSQAVIMYEAGLSLRDIALFYNIRHQGIYDALRRRNVKMRSNRPCLLPLSGPHKYVRTLARRAIEKGILKPGSCEICSTHNTEAHHDDYNQPLKVRWLCREHHLAWHKDNIPIQKRSN